MVKHTAVGQNVPRIDGLDKVTGQTKFMSDLFISDPQLLHAKILWSTHPHARILKIDISEAERLPGVEFVLTGEQAPEHRHGQGISDRYIIAKEFVHSQADPVAAVAARSADIAQEAIELIKVDYEELPAIFDPEQAFGTDPSVIIHPDLRQYKMGDDIRASLSDVTDMPNVCGRHKIRQGDVEQAFKEADFVIENRYTADRIAHGQMENDFCVAQVDTDGVLTVWTSHRVIFRLKRLLMQALGSEASRVRIINTYIGGSFGRFPFAEYVAALMAMHTRQPVSIRLTREECFRYTPTGTPEVLYVKDGVKNDGTIIAREVKILLNAGAYSHQAPRLVQTASYGAGTTYNIPNFKLDAYAVYTNDLINCMHRGVNVPQTQWGIENNMDEIAQRLKMDPVALRRQNLYRDGDRNAYGEIITGMGLEECIDKVTEFIGLDKASEKPNNGPWRYGKGVSTGSKYVAAGGSFAIVKMHPDGLLELRHGSDEVGQGSDTVLAQMVAEEFCVGMDRVRVVRGDSAFVPYSDGASGSRTTFVVGKAIKSACDDLKLKIFEMAAKRLNVLPTELDTADGKIFLKAEGHQESSIDFAELFKGGLMDQSSELLGTGSFVVKPSPVNPDTGQSERFNICYTYQAHAAEVAVNMETGEAKVLRFGSAYNIGRAINPKLCEAQIEGGMTMAISMALWEKLTTDRGEVLNPNFADYRMATAPLLPNNDNIKSMIVEVPHEEGPYGARGLGEATICGHASAIRAAIHEATGVWLYDMPMTAERILKAIKDQGVT